MVANLSFPAMQLKCSILFHLKLFDLVLEVTVQNRKISKGWKSTYEPKPYIFGIIPKNTNTDINKLLYYIIYETINVK